MNSTSESPILPFPLRHVMKVEPRPEGQTWLVERLVTYQAAVLVGGASKCCKTWLGCELALAVATGAPALGRFAVPNPGPVIFYGAEDNQPDLRKRLEGMARARGLLSRLRDAPLFLLDVNTLRLDRAEHIARLRTTVAGAKPALVVLDPFVRLARIDENSAAEVSAVLGELRTIQRELGTTILLAHHMRKSPSAHKGHQLRGSGDFAAWHDSALYASGSPEDLTVHVEHRNASPPDPLRLRLVKDDNPHLEIVGQLSPATSVKDPVHASILERLASTARPLSTGEIRKGLRARKQTVTTALTALEHAGQIVRSGAGWCVPAPVPDTARREQPRSPATLSHSSASGKSASLFPDFHP